MKKKIKQVVTPNYISITTVKNKLALFSKGRKQHFEFAIKKDKVNKEELEQDFTEFHIFIKLMNELSLLH